MTKTITAQELKAKLDNEDDFKLIMTMPPEVFDAMHIPGSLQVSDMETGLQQLEPDDEIVVYCSSPSCTASRQIYYVLTEKYDFRNVTHYAGGLEEWQAAGYPVEGSH